MKTIKLIFLILSIVLPLIFIILAIINIKTVKKSKKSKIRILIAIVLLFGINFTAYKFLPQDKPIENSPPKKEKTEDKKDEDVKPVNDNIENSNVVLNGTTSKGMKIETKDGVTKIDGLIFVNKDYSISKDYVPQDTQKTVTKSTKTCAECIVKEVYDAFTTMKEDAAKKGLKLWIQSGYRSYDYQYTLYNTYVKRDGLEKADTYSAKAGHSEHQTGYAFDLNSVKDEFANTKEGKWINANAYKYGFIIRYPKGKENETGYKYEPWHLRFVGIELAKVLYNEGNWISLESYFGLIS